MAQAHSYDTPVSTPSDQTDGTESQAPAGDAFTSTPGALSKAGPGNWGVAARWIMFALLAIAFVVCLTVFL